MRQAADRSGRTEALFGAGARRDKPRLRFLFVASAVFGVGATAAALMPSYWGFAAALLVVGLAAQTMMTTANGAVQLSTPAPRHPCAVA